MIKCNKYHSILITNRLSLVFTSFFPAHRNVCRHTLFSFFRFTSSYVDYRTKMSPTCMFCVLQRGSWVRTGVHAPMPTQAILPTSQHITSINIRSIFDGLVCRRACQRRDGSCKKNKHILCFFTSTSSSSSSPSSSPPSSQAPPSPHPTGNRSICSDATFPAAAMVRWSRRPY